MGSTWMMRGPLAGLLLALGLALAGCGSGPSVRQHKTFHVEGASKVKRVLFFYQEVVLQQKTTYQRGSGNISVSANERAWASSDRRSSSAVPKLSAKRA